MPQREDEGDRSPDGEAEALVKLREHEHDLDCRLEDARREAEAILAEVRREAERLKERAKAELRGAVERLHQEQARQVEQALAAIQEENRRRGRALRHQAELNREQAVAWLVSRVTGSDLP
jgi:vacuolar-type H+-ATPase subunit H